MVTLADARNASAKPGSVTGDLLVLLSGAGYAVRTCPLPAQLCCMGLLMLAFAECRPWCCPSLAAP